MGAKTAKDAGNPFAALDIRHFPAERRKSPVGSAGAGRSGPAKKRQAAAPVPEADDDPDAALFLQAVGPVRGLNVDNASARSRQPSADSAHVPDPVPDKDICRNVDEDMPAAPSLPSGRSGEPRNDRLAQELARSLAERQGGRSGLTEKKQRSLQERMPPEKPGKPSALLAEAVGLADPDEESAAFCSAVADVAPLAGKGRTVPPRPAPIPAPATTPANPLQDIVDGKVEFALSGTDEFMEGHVVGLDLLTVGKLQARQYSPEAHVDLHGLNSEQAFQQLVGFFRSAYHKGVRTALVVTGRGLNSPNGMPVLRFKVQQWFTQEPFRRVVLAFCTAKREDGGPGALYVLLRKYRKNSGKVRWDVMPTDPDLFRP